MCRLCFGPGKAIAAAAGARNPRPELPVPRAGSGLPGRHEVYDCPLGGLGVHDPVATAYLADLLSAVNAAPANVASGGRLEAVHVDSDGNCLHHAVSRAIFGREVFHAEIRAQVAAELEAHAAWYLEHVYMGSDVDFQADLSDARTAGEWSSTNQIVAIANVLRRPVVLLASLAHMNGTARGGPGGTATYLPARHRAPECATNPLLLAWQTGAADGRHYVALCRTAGAGVELPPACRPVGVAPAGFAAEEYIPVGCFCLSGLQASSFSERNPINNPFVAEVRAFAVAGRLALAALQSRPNDFVTALLQDEDFMARAEAAGLLALVAIVQHVSEREASQAFCDAVGEIGVEAESDAAADAALKHILDGLPAHTAAALRLCICNETITAIYEKVGKRSSTLDGVQRLNLSLTVATVMVRRAELNQHALLAAALAQVPALAQEPAAAAPAQQPVEPQAVPPAEQAAAHAASAAAAATPAEAAQPATLEAAASVQLSEEERARRWQAHLAKAMLRGVELRHRARRMPGADDASAAKLRATESAPAVLMSGAQLAASLLSELRNATSATEAHKLPKPPAPLKAVPSVEAQENSIVRTLSGRAIRSALGKRKSYPESDSEAAGDDKAV